MSSGLDAAFAMIDVARTGGRTPRVVLISDGLANQGDASREGLVGRAARAARGEYALSTVGVGADFDEGLMAALADAGTGNFHSWRTRADSTASSPPSSRPRARTSRADCASRSSRHRASRSSTPRAIR